MYRNRELVETSRVAEEKRRLTDAMLKRGELYNIDILPVRGDDSVKWIVISD